MVHVQLCPLLRRDRAHRRVQTHAIHLSNCSVPLLLTAPQIRSSTQSHHNRTRFQAQPITPTNAAPFPRGRPGPSPGRVGDNTCHLQWWRSLV